MNDVIRKAFVQYGAIYLDFLFKHNRNVDDFLKLFEAEMTDVVESFTNLPKINIPDHPKVQSKKDLLKEINNILRDLYGNNQKLHVLRKCFVKNLENYIDTQYHDMNIDEIRQKVLTEIIQIHEE